MRKFNVFSTLVAILASVAATAAYADGVPERYAAPVALTPTTWTGPYFGLHAGYGWSDTNITFVPAAGPVFPERWRWRAGWQARTWA